MRVDEHCADKRQHWVEARAMADDDEAVAKERAHVGDTAPGIHSPAHRLARARADPAVEGSCSASGHSCASISAFAAKPLVGCQDDAFGVHSFFYSVFEHVDTDHTVFRALARAIPGAIVNKWLIEAERARSLLTCSVETRTRPPFRPRSVCKRGTDWPARVMSSPSSIGNSRSSASHST